jgi:hypothetical protein
MIDEQLCAGVRCVNGGALVSWFLTYPDGSMGMLFTIQVSLSYVGLLRPTSHYHNKRCFVGASG